MNDSTSSLRRCVPLLHMVLVMSLLLNLCVPPARAAQASARAQIFPEIVTVVAAAIAADKVLDNAIDKAGAMISNKLREASAHMKEILAILKDDLIEWSQFTIDALGQEISNQLNEIYAESQAIISYGRVSMSLLIDEIDKRIGDRLAQIQRMLYTALSSINYTVITAINGAKVIVTQATDSLLKGLGIVAIIAGVILVAVGFYVRARYHSLPVVMGISVAVLLAVAGSVTLLYDPLRAWLIDQAHWDRELQEIDAPALYDANPNEIIVGKTKGLTLYGYRLLADGQPLAISIGNIAIPADRVSGGDTMLYIDLQGIDLSPEASNTQLRQVRLAAPNARSATVNVYMPRPAPQLIAATLTPLGQTYKFVVNDYDYDRGCLHPGPPQCPPSEPGCTTPWSCSGDPESVNFDLPLGYVLSFRQMPAGYSERINLNNGFDRSINVRENGITVNVGLRVTDDDYGRFRFGAHYQLFGEAPGDDYAPSERTWTLEQPCVIDGSVQEIICGEYPYKDEWANFVPGTLQYDVRATFVNAYGETGDEPVTRYDVDKPVNVALDFEDDNGERQTRVISLQIDRDGRLKIAPPLPAPPPADGIDPEQLQDILEQAAKEAQDLVAGATSE